MKKITLRELCSKHDLEMADILEYEEKGFIEPIDRVDGWFRNYPRETSAKIHVVRAYQKIGFSLDETKKIMEMPPEEAKLVLVSRVICLEQLKKNIESAIDLAKEIVRVQN